MSAKDTGGAAFPCIGIVARDERGNMHGPEISGPGMTLRDYFAASASEGDIAQHTPIYSYDGAYVVGNRTREQAKYAYADSMLAARKEAQ